MNARPKPLTGAAALGTLILIIGVLFIGASLTRGFHSYGLSEPLFFGALLVISGLLLRIEGAIKDRSQPPSS